MNLANLFFFVGIFLCQDASFFFCLRWRHFLFEGKSCRRDNREWELRWKQKEGHSGSWFWNYGTIGARKLLLLSSRYCNTKKNKAGWQITWLVLFWKDSRYLAVTYRTRCRRQSILIVGPTHQYDFNRHFNGNSRSLFFFELDLWNTPKCHHNVVTVFPSQILDTAWWTMKPSFQWDSHGTRTTAIHTWSHTNESRVQQEDQLEEVFCLNTAVVGSRYTRTR